MISIEARTIDGITYLSAPDLAAAFRTRAAEIEATADALNDPTGKGEDVLHSFVFYGVAEELRNRATALDLAVIEHITDHPGDSG